MFRVQKLLSKYGYCSRRKAEQLIQEGRVKVNGKVITIGDQATENDKISVDDKIVKGQRLVYLMFNKPLGCVTALTDSTFDTIMDYIDIKERVFPIGRLDYNTSGLLLLTNDGDFANKVMHPRYETNKTYLVGLQNPIKDKDLDKIRGGISLDDGMTSPAKVKRKNSTMLEITIHEGKNRILRRIFEKLGYKVKFLQRIKVGKLGLGNLKPGKYKQLTKEDLDLIFL
ncbi:MAG: pseudouridine synthase [Candidatus Woesearchaeota archaeon]